MTAVQKIDTDRIKKGIDIRELGSMHVDLRKEGPEERSGPCPKCGGEDRFHCKADWFFCRKCHEKRGDAIEFVMWLKGCNFQDACRSLQAGGLPGVETRQVPQAKATQPRGSSQLWQQQARREVDRAIAILDGLAGGRGRDYLKSRGIDPETWRVWGLGYRPDLQRKFQRNGDWHVESLGAAITLPWQEQGVVKAVQYRFFDDQAKLRYWQKAGGDRTLFGLNLLAGRTTLIVCEGELNAISLWQSLHDMVDVVSFGSESNLEHASDALKSLTDRYKQVIVWADKSDRSRACQRIAGLSAKALKSPRGLDANDLLQTGQLRDFVIEVLRRFGLLEPDEETTETESTIPEDQRISPRYYELLNKSHLWEDEVAELRLLAELYNRRLQWQQCEINDSDRGWYNVN